jgi:hypothetical protein
MKKQNDFIPTSMFLGTVGLAKAIAACASKKELQQLYTDNKERIDTIPELKEVFIKKKKEMRKRLLNYFKLISATKYKNE